MPPSELNEILSRLRELFAAEYQRGEAAAIARMKAALETPSEAPARMRRLRPPASDKKPRAKRGLPEAFVRRVLEQQSPSGVAAADVSGFSETEEESLVSSSSIRAMLAQGASAGWARNENGLWYWALQEEKN